MENEYDASAYSPYDNEKFAENFRSFMGIWKEAKTEIKEELKATMKIASPGVQFILLYYLGLLNSEIFTNRTKAGKILELLFGNGNAEDYRRWYSSFQTDKQKILDIQLDKVKEPVEVFRSQIITIRNFERVCEILKELGFTKEFEEANVILFKLEYLRNRGIP